MDRHIIILLSSVVLYSSGCLDFETGKNSIESITDNPKYYTANDNHRWKDLSKDHLPEIKFVNEEKTKIRVKVPLRPVQNPPHYIEAIALMKDEKQVDIKRFRFTFKEAEAEFVLPDKKARYWILVKCNKHDMWKEYIPKK